MKVSRPPKAGRLDCTVRPKRQNGKPEIDDGRKPRKSKTGSPRLTTGANREKARRHRGDAMLEKKLKTGAMPKGAARQEAQNPTNNRLRR